MSEPWGRTPVRVWRAIVAAADARPAGEPWPWHEAAISLALEQREQVYHRDACAGPFPGYRSWAARWSWSESRARTLMRDEAAWSDPLLATTDAWREAVPVSRTHRAPIAQSSRTSRAEVAHPAQVEPAVSSSESLTSSAPVAQSSRTYRADAATRARKVQETQTHTPTQDTDTQSERASRAALEVQPDRKRKPRQLDPSTLAVWEHYRSRCPQRTSDAPPAYLAGPIAQAVKQHGPDDVRLLLDWLADGDGRAEYLRREGYAWSDTPWRPSKLPPYLDLARAWDARGRIAAPQQQHQRGSTVTERFDAKLRAALARERDSIIDATPEPQAPVLRLLMPYHAPAPTPAPAPPEADDDIPF